MKKLVLVYAFMAFCTLGTIAQQTGGYVITKVETYDLNIFTSALERCNFDSYRKQNERVTLHFEDGSTVELLSINEMLNNGLGCDTQMPTPSNYKESNVFQLHPDGYIMEKVSFHEPLMGQKKKMIYEKQKQ